MAASGMRRRMPVHRSAEALERVGTAHRRQHPVAGVLQRQVEVRQEARGRRDSVEDLLAAVHRLERTEAERDIGSCRRRVDRREQVEQRPRGPEVAAVGAQVNPGDPQFLEAGRGRHAARRPPPRRADGSCRRPSCSGRCSRRSARRSPSGREAGRRCGRGCQDRIRLPAPGCRLPARYRCLAVAGCCQPPAHRRSLDATVVRPAAAQSRPCRRSTRAPSRPASSPGPRACGWRSSRWR